MPKKKAGLFDYLDETAIAILKLLKNSKWRYSELQKESPISPGAFNTRINQLIDLRLVKVDYSQKDRRPYYSLTDTGKRVLELLEEIERVYKEGYGEDKELKGMVGDLER